MTMASTPKRLMGFAAIAILAAACSSPGAASVAPSAAAPSAAASAEASSAAPSEAAKQFKIGYSNGGGVGNGFREEQVCTAKAEATSSGQVSELVVKHRNTDAAGQASDIRDLIAAGVDAIVFNPNDLKALNSALQEAKQAGIKTVSVDAFVTDPDTLQPVQRPGSSTPRSAPSGCSISSAAAAPCGTCAGSPAIRPTPTGTRLSRTSSRTTRASRSSRTLTAWPPDGIRRGRPADHGPHHWRAAMTTDPGDLDLGHGPADHRLDQARATRRSCRSPAPTEVASSSSCSTRTAAPTAEGCGGDNPPPSAAPGSPRAQGAQR